jgi:phospholipid/cholesterol/gamma-HCH transport system substrate-binding protein
MPFSRSVKIQLAIFAVVTAVATMVILFGYIKIPSLLGVGHYSVTVQLPRSAGLYASSNVTYRGTEVGRVSTIRLTDTGVEAVLSLRSDVQIPANLDAQVHSVSAIGEQYVALEPLSVTGQTLKDGDVIPASHTTVPPDINALLAAANRGLDAIPGDNLQTVIDESNTAIGGLGPELARFVKGSTRLAIDARANLDPLTAVIDQSQPVLDSQADTADAIQSWATHLATITRELQANDTSVAGLLEHGGRAADEARQLIDRLKPTLPLLLANLVSIGQIGITYQPALEQLLVLLPQSLAEEQAAVTPDRHLPYNGGLNMDFKLNTNLPPPCTTGFLPPQQKRTPTFEDVPPRPPGYLYCRIPQDSWNAVRGARNSPCLTRPGKRAPTEEMCESDEQYVPLNDGNNWKGDPNATLSGQSVPQLPRRLAPAQAAPPPGSPPAPAAPPPAPIAAAEYEPATGTYVGPDGNVYRQTDLAQTGPKDKTWQSMLTPPTPN